MILSLMYVLIAVLILSFLIFIHELGHYYMARRVGMRVEAFSIGIGRAIYSWKRNGVDWRIGWLPFGGYVKIAGGEEDEGVDPYTIRDGFFGKPPLDRIKVSLAGPIANLVFALFVFTGIWLAGGRMKTFHEYTPTIGWVDPNSELYEAGVRPGDEITQYADRDFQNSNDHMMVPMTHPEAIHIVGKHVNQTTGERTPMDITVPGYPNPLSADPEVLTAGILSPASYLIYDTTGQDMGPHGLAAGSPLLQSGIQKGDRVVWANGDVIYSAMQLSHRINDERALLTIQRNNKTFLRRVPRVLVQELKLDPEFRDEIIDWQYEAQLNRQKVLKLFTLPYNITADGVVETPLRFIDSDEQERVFPTHLTSSELDAPLEVGDKVLAINGKPVSHAYEILSEVQEPKVVMIVLRQAEVPVAATVKQANEQFSQEINWTALQDIVNSIGHADSVQSTGGLYLLPPIGPKTHEEFPTTTEGKQRYANELAAQKAAILHIDNAEKRSVMLQKHQDLENQLFLGPPAFVDRKVTYNPSPFRMFADVCADIWRTLTALVTGRLNPKWMSGPVGIISVVQQNWQSSIKEGIYWIGVISLNLGLLNLLPIPVLDGGSICFSLFEMATGRKLKTKTLEKLIIPFALLLMTFLLFVTYQDVLRVFTKFLG